MKIVEELRERAANMWMEGNATVYDDPLYFNTAAALIERMAESLKPFEAMSRHHLSASDGVEAMRYTLGSDVRVLTWGAFRRARSVLEEAGYV